MLDAFTLIVTPHLLRALLATKLALNGNVALCMKKLESVFASCVLLLGHDATRHVLHEVILCEPTGSALRVAVEHFRARADSLHFLLFYTSPELRPRFMPLGWCSDMSAMPPIPPRPTAALPSRR